jgi:uncharacterized protein YfaS (alpha-2-macroglobulin family)
MQREMVILSVGVITLIVAGIAAFGTYDSSNTSHSASAITKDYTSEFESIKTSLDEVTKQLADLESDTLAELNDIRLELADVKITNKPQIDTSLPFNISINKVEYSKGEPVVVFAHNILPQKSMTLQLLSSFNEVITTTTVRSDNSGKLNYLFQIPSFVPSGDYKIKATTTDGNTSTIFFSIIDKTIVAPTNTPVTGLSIILEKSSYNPGDMIHVTGFAEANKPLTAELLSPDSEIATAYSNSSSDNTYTLIFILDEEAEPGNWNLKVIQGEIEETITFTVTN